MEGYVTTDQFWEGMRQLAADLNIPSTVNLTAIVNTSPIVVPLTIIGMALAIIAVCYAVNTYYRHVRKPRPKQKPKHHA